MRYWVLFCFIVASVPSFAPPAASHEIPEPPCEDFFDHGVTQVSIIFPGGTSTLGVTGVGARELWTFAATESPLVTLHWALRPIPYTVGDPYPAGYFDVASPVVRMEERSPNEALCLEVHNPTTQLVTATMGFRSRAAPE